MVIVERVAGKIKAAPIPLRALKAITSFASEAPKNSKSLVNNVAPFAIIKTKTPKSNIRLRPNLSPRAPAGRSNTAKEKA